jgi:hypothetical protein
MAEGVAIAYRFETSGGYGTTASLIEADPSQPDSILIPDAELLFTGQFSRAGNDLILRGNDGHRTVVANYFASEHPPALAAPNGSKLSGDLVELLAGSPASGHYAQAQSTTPPAEPTRSPRWLPTD